MSQLGLRTCEVASLRLEDLDWSRSCLRLVGTKQRRDAVLPIPTSVARAIALYIERGRPETDAVQLFVRMRAPLGKGLQAHHVRSAMRRAFARSGLPSVGVHVLRHTFATTLYRGGLGLKPIADLLGHRSLDTTARYARVHFDELRSMALPWPGARK